MRLERDGVIPIAPQSRRFAHLDPRAGTLLDDDAIAAALARRIVAKMRDEQGALVSRAIVRPLT